MYKKYFKRLMDIACSGLSIIVFLPLFTVVAILIKFDSKGPVFYTQKRTGKDKQDFSIIKFRTMRILEDSYKKDGSVMENYERITRLGHLLRKTSIDELPQIFNIFKGEMSIVGPRPTLPYQVEKYDSVQMQRLNVKPGLTGLAQISGRNTLSWEEKIRHDIQYVNNVSFLNDVAIILKTVLVLFKSDQIAFSQHDSISIHSKDLLEDIGSVRNGEKADRNNKSCNN